MVAIWKGFFAKSRQVLFSLVPCVVRSPADCAHSSGLRILSRESRLPPGGYGANFHQCPILLGEEMQSHGGQNGTGKNYRNHNFSVRNEEQFSAREHAIQICASENCTVVFHDWSFPH